MSPTPAAAAPRLATDQQEQGASTSSAPRSIPSRSQTGGKNHHRGTSRDHGTPKASPGGVGRAFASQAPLGTIPHAQQYANSSSPTDRSSSLRSTRYGNWPSGNSSSYAQGVNRSSSGPRTGSGSTAGRQGSKQFTFNWPAYMDHGQLTHAIKKGHVFRAKFRINAENRTEAFCTLEGLPSDITVRGDINHNRAVEGDEVAVLPFKLKDWFTVYKEREKLAELGLLPEGDADPLALADKLSDMAIAANDPDGIAAAQSPWTTAGGPVAALKVIEDALRARPDMRATGKVVAILEPSQRREAIIGVLLTPEVAMAATAAPAGANLPPPAAAAAANLASGVYEGCLMLVPMDPRLPKGVVTPGVAAGLPEALRVEAASSNLTTRTFVAARITEWPANSPFPMVEVRTSLGPTGDIETGTAALLAAEGLKEEDFSLEVYACLPKVPWRIAATEAATRADFSGWRIFSIDPITARDLDDALSIQPIGNGRWRMGVHIADVASFVTPGTALDEEAQKRGTSIYLVQRVIPMLPRLLCEQLCSLQPGDPRFAFSIVWEIDEDGHIYKEWAGRSIINSCAKLAYPMVQQMIEGTFDPANWQVQLFRGVTWDQVTFDCLALHGIATRLRAARFSGGALRLTNTRLCFALDTGGNPVSASPYVQSDANHLVEEFMLLANMRVAGIIARAFPSQALLRRHPSPSERKMAVFKAAAALLGVNVDMSSAGALQRSLHAVREACPDDATREVVMLLATKPMQLAQYFCTGEAPEESEWRHYALAMAMYTHFTSPIRRYPDVIVHRLLQAALELAQHLGQPDNAELLALPVEATAKPPTPVPITGQADGTAEIAANSDADSSMSSNRAQLIPPAANEEAATEDVEGTLAAAAAAAAAVILEKHQLPDKETMAKIAKHSNDTKYSARMASDSSLKLYLCIMLKQQPVVSWAVVTAVGGDKFFHAYLPEFGCETKLCLEQMGVQLVGSWEEATQTLTIGNDQSPQQQATGSSAAAAANADSRHQQQEQEQQEKRLAPDMLLNSPEFNLREWLDTLKQGVRNTERLQYAQLPLQVRTFSRIPVVVGTRIHRITCHPVDVAAKIWLDVGWSSSSDEHAAAAAVAEQQLVPSTMAYETLLED